MSEFDTYAHDYAAALDRGISVSGEDADFFARERIRWLAGCLDDWSSPSPPTVLDYGCGTGTATRYFLELLGAESVTGVDLSAGSLEVAREQCAGLSARFCLPCEYAPDGAIDLAYCNGVFHHIPKLERLAAVQYIADCLRPGGIFALWENNPWSPAARYVMSRIPFDRDAIMVWPQEARELAKSAGLQILATDYRFIFPKSLSVLRGTEAWLRAVPLGAQYQVLCRKPNQ